MLPVGCLDGGRAQVPILYMERCIFYFRTRSLMLPCIIAFSKCVSCFLVWETCTDYIWFVNLCNSWTKSVKCPRHLLIYLTCVMLGLSGMFKYAIYFPFDFSTFQLGSPLALPWGLYVLICQLQKNSELCNFECYFFFWSNKEDVS